LTNLNRRSRVELVCDRQLDLRGPGVALARDGRRRPSPGAVKEGFGRVVPRSVLALLRQHPVPIRFCCWRTRLGGRSRPVATSRLLEVIIDTKKALRNI